MQTLRETHKPYSIFEIYHVKYTNLLNLKLGYIFIHCAVKSHVYHVKYTGFHINTIFMHNVDFKRTINLIIYLKC